MLPLASPLLTRSPQNFTPEVKEKAAIYVPAIGKVTIMILLRNLLVSQTNLFDQNVF